MAAATGVVHPIINLERPDLACDPDFVPREARHRTDRAALANFFGLGRQRACLVVGKYSS